MAKGPVAKEIVFALDIPIQPAHSAGWISSRQHADNKLVTGYL
jgi:hypothetical protein